MRRVFSNAQCAHVWAQQSQPDGRGSSVKFDDTVFYSYQTPIARLVRNAHGERVCLLTAERFSVTTDGKHKHHVTSAVRGTAPVFIVPDLFPDGTTAAGYYSRGASRFPSHAEPDHGGNVAHFLKEYSDAKAQLMRSPCESWRVRDLAPADGAAVPTAAHQTLAALVNTFSDYSDHFKLGLAAPDWRGDAAEVIARRDRLASDPKRMAKRAARAAIAAAETERKRIAAAERDRVARLENADKVLAWRAGADVYLPWGAQRDADGGAMLRVKGDKVQTSLGAEAPVSHVRRVLAFVASLTGPWQRTTTFTGRDLFTLGHFALDSVDANGNVRAGCHYITAAEVSALRETLRDKFASEQQAPSVSNI